MRDGTIDVTAHDSERADSGEEVADGIREFVQFSRRGSISATLSSIVG